MIQFCTRENERNREKAVWNGSIVCNHEPVQQLVRGSQIETCGAATDLPRLSPTHWLTEVFQSLSAISELGMPSELGNLTSPPPPGLSQTHISRLLSRTLRSVLCWDRMSVRRCTRIGLSAAREDSLSVGLVRCSRV